MSHKSDTQDIFTANIIQETQVTKQALNEIESRHTEILRLEKSIRELHDMFMYLALEVEAQGELINNIDNAVGSNYVKKAAQAATSRRNSLKKKVCLITCVSILLLIIIAINVAVATTS
ncbi:syntaxin-4-like [Amblyraja radiata]|uniref:syntaxin-4-like n=1 Tax=Amblyraja radiata TaxID=386614 RepID=UPI0014037F4C|nr:syntaxin-4-like [Amblyraja radiata]